MNTTNIPVPTRILHILAAFALAALSSANCRAKFNSGRERKKLIMRRNALMLACSSSLS